MAICSIFGQINGIVAHAMAMEGKVKLIGPDLIPPSMLFDEHGERASCALVFTPDSEREFNERVRNMRA